MGRPLESTKYGKGLNEKAGVSPHLGSTTETWEEEFSMRLESDIRENLIMEPLFRTIAMNTVSMHIPINPETAYGEWIARTYPPLRSADGASTGTAQDHEIVDTTLTAHKLVSKEYLGDEEEEDSILPLMPIVRDAVMRRMAKAADRALLRGDATVATGDGDTYPFNGVYTVGLDATNNTTNPVGTKVTVAQLQTVRRDLGVWGLNPSDLIYIVSQDVYYDLLEDADFRTIDVVGSQATILRGQIGSVNGSPVVVSGEFAAKGIGAGAAVCLNKANFIVGNLRNVRVETDRSVEDQKNIIVASRRMGFLDLISGKGSSVLTWAA
jgi:HK97 family phage major capsid protein